MVHLNCPLDLIHRYVWDKTRHIARSRARITDQSFSSYDVSLTYFPDRYDGVTFRSLSLTPHLKLVQMLDFSAAHPLVRSLASPPPRWDHPQAAPGCGAPVVHVFTDGSYIREEGKGGAAAVFVTPEIHSVISSGDPSTVDSFPLTRNQGVILSSVPNCLSSTHSELTTFALALLCVAVDVILSLYTDSQSAIHILNRLSSAPHRWFVRSWHRALFRLLALLVAQKRQRGALVTTVKVQAHTGGSSREALGNALSDVGAALARAAPNLLPSLSNFDFQFSFTIGCDSPVGDPAKAVRSALPSRYLRAWKSSQSQGALANEEVVSFLGKVRPKLAASSWSFALCLFTNCLPFRLTCIQLAERSAPLAHIAFERLAELSSCPLCCNGLDDLSHLLHCPSLDSVRREHTHVVLFLKSNCSRLRPPELAGCFTSSTLPPVRRPVSFGAKVIALWHALWRRRCALLPPTFKPHPWDLSSLELDIVLP